MEFKPVMYDHLLAPLGLYGYYAPNTPDKMEAAQRLALIKKGPTFFFYGWILN